MRKLFYTAIEIVVLICLFLDCSAQKQKPLRVEFDARHYSDKYNIVPIGKEGLLLFYDDEEKTKEGRKWIISKYNTDLKEVWSENITVPGAVDFIKYYYDDVNKNLFILLGRNRTYASEVSFMTNNKGDYAILTVDISNGKIKTVTGHLLGQTGLNDFKVINNTAFFSGWCSSPRINGCLQNCFTLTLIPTFTGLTIDRYKPFVMAVNIETGQQKNEIFDFRKHAFAVESQIDKNNNNPGIEIFIKNRPDNKTANAYLYRYNAAGDLLRKLSLSTNEYVILNNAKFFRVNDRESILIGTYDNLIPKLRNPMSPYSTGYTNDAVGMYFAKFTNETQEYIKFYPFSKFAALYSYMSTKSKIKADKKMERARNNGRNVQVTFSLLVHDIIPRNDHYLMIAEAYYPEYHYEYYTTYVNGSPQTDVRKVFDGYRYTHALIAGFDKEGELIFNNSFELWDILTFNLNERVKVMLDGENVVLTYSSGGSIASKIISGNSVIEGKTETPIETLSEDDKVKSNWRSDMAFWYDNYFVTYGYQRIKDKKDNSKRTVFYFNKIGFE